VKTGTVEVLRVPILAVPLRLLIVEHSPEDVELVLLTLKESGVAIDHTLVQTRDEFRQALQSEEYDAVLCDYRLPSWSGLDALQELRESGKDIPFLLITGTLGEEAAVECMKRGINDYILKGHISRLPMALRRAVAEKAMRNENTQAQGALRLAEARNQDLFENSIYGIFRATFDGCFVDGNPALLEILGRSSAEELKGLNLLRDVHRFPEQCMQLIAECREHGQVRGAEMEWRRGDGGIVAVRLNVRRLSIPNHPDCMEFIAEDVTEFRAMERQLRQAQKFEAIGQLAGGIAHDFNNVVGAILGWAELGIEQNRMNPQVTDRFTKIREQAERAATLTRELLAFARRQVLQPSAVDLNSVTSGLVSFLDKVIPTNIELKVMTGTLDAVKADPTQIEQVLMNLCLNARDAMPEGGRLLIETEMAELDESYCRYYPQATPGRYALLSVSDTGQGMNAETRERIFEPFYTTKEKGKGTGMGLATVYGIVKQHGGFIHVYSEPGQGSLFRVYLPALAGASSDGHGAKAPAPSFSDLRGTETILIAEDHESIREMARQTLANLGYRVLAATDGAEALRLCQLEAPAMAILDVIMPKMGGPAAGAKLTALFDGIPLLYTSGYSQDSENMAPAGPDARYLQKPYSPTTLGRIVREILDQRNEARTE